MKKGGNAEGTVGKGKVASCRLFKTRLLGEYRPRPRFPGCSRGMILARSIQFVGRVGRNLAARAISSWVWRQWRRSWGGGGACVGSRSLNQDRQNPRTTPLRHKAKGRQLRRSASHRVGGGGEPKLDPQPLSSTLIEGESTGRVGIYHDPIEGEGIPRRCRRQDEDGRKPKDGSGKKARG